MKTNDKEIREIPIKIIEKQKKKLLIITKGDKGADIYFYGKKYSFKVNKIKAADYIGSGDTFFANFICSFLKTEGDVVTSGEVAIRETREFLLNKR
jgi:sugar/nucleoside kinase (ribokinase family)